MALAAMIRVPQHIKATTAQDAPRYTTPGGAFRATPNEVPCSGAGPCNTNKHVMSERSTLTHLGVVQRHQALAQELGILKLEECQTLVHRRDQLHFGELLFGVVQAE